jgi:hypothetical protein
MPEAISSPPAITIGRWTNMPHFTHWAYGLYCQKMPNGQSYIALILCCFFAFGFL